MKKMIDDYSLKEVLGEGVYGQVYRAINVKTNLQVAIKVIPVKKFHEIPKLEEFTVNEIKILGQINKQCQFIVKYVDMLKTANNFYFVYQFCNGGTLAKMIQRQGKLEQKKALIYLKQMLQAFKILSQRNIMHRDLKPENILFHNNTVRLADFGFCKPLSNKDDLAETMLGSPIYMAPQVLKGQIYSIKADIWSLGVVTYQMVYGKCPFESKTIASLIKLFQNQNFVLPPYPKISTALQQFLKRCLVKDYMQRISWEQIFNTYVITDLGQIINKKTIPIMGGEIRSSMRINSNTQRLPAQPYRNTVVYQPPQLSMLNSPKNLIGNPQYMQNGNKSFDPGNQSNNFLASRKSPIKMIPDASNNKQINGLNFKMPQLEHNDFNEEHNSAETSNKSSGIVQKNIKNSGTSQKTSASQQNPMNEEIHFQDAPASAELQNCVSTSKLPSSRIDILIKNHNKTIQINQMLLNVYDRGHNSADYVCFLIFNSVCRELQILQQKFRENRSYGNQYQLKKIIQLELENTTGIIQNYLQIFIEMAQTSHKESEIQQFDFLCHLKPNSSSIDLQKILLKNKYKILKNYIDYLPDCEEDIRLASQVVDYILDDYLIKRDAYDRMSKEHLLKQMKNKISKIQT